MKKSILLALGMLIPTTSIIPISSPDTIVVKQKKRNKKAYAQLMLGFMLTGATLGCFIGGLRVATGSKECYQHGNYLRAIGNLIAGPALVALTLPLGEAAFKCMHRGIKNFWHNEEDQEVKK